MSKKEILQNLREDYQKHVLTEENAHENPFDHFHEWLDEALEAKIPEPNAMVFASVNEAGAPSARVLLLKGLDEAGFVFYTNYNSQKGKELAQNPQCTMVFNWLQLEKQIRIEGRAEKITAEESDDYFGKRPKGSQIGAWASPQSEVIPNRDILEENVQQLQKEYADADRLPRPQHWGGYRLVPTRIEFWQGRSSRLHDRLNYTRQISGDWKLERLAP